MLKGDVPPPPAPPPGRGSDMGSLSTVRASLPPSLHAAFGSSVSIVTRASDSMATVKTKLEQVLGVEATAQTLLFDGSALSDGATLGSCDVGDGTALTLLVSGPPPSLSCLVRIVLPPSLQAVHGCSTFTISTSSSATVDHLKSTLESTLGVASSSQTLSFNGATLLGGTLGGIAFGDTLVLAVSGSDAASEQSTNLLSVEPVHRAPPSLVTANVAVRLKAFAALSRDGSGPSGTGNAIEAATPMPGRIRNNVLLTPRADEPTAISSSWSLLRALRKAKTKAVNILEGATGIDIDGDGDVGVDSEPQRSTWKRWQKLNRRILKPPTAQQIDIVGAEMEAIVAARCSYVRLEIARRRLIVLKEIKFYGSKHAAGVDTYAEPQLAEQICAEVGIALQLCNGMCYAALTLFMPWSRPHPRRHPSSLLTYDRALSNRRLAARARCRTARARR